MSAIQRVQGCGIPLRGNDIDTDRIIPARFLRCVTFEGLGAHAFEDDRVEDAANGSLHPFDDTRFATARVLVANANFGCGSSREHAPQAIFRRGIRAIVAQSFSEIFFGNTVAIGMPCVTVTPHDSWTLQEMIEGDPALEVTVDLAASTVSAGGWSFTALMPEGARQQFLSGDWDATRGLLEGMDEVRAAVARLPYFAWG